MPPHVYNIAHDSFYGVTSFDQLQSIVISGESGAGKTEATKQCLQYLAAIAGSVSGVEKKILMANPILEAFGNAKTLRNDNSSRFGKYLEVYFNSNGKIASASTSNYLLEKIRVVQPAAGERNFHIFYNLIKAAPAALKEQLRITGSASDYIFTAGCTDVASIDDTKDFAEVEQAFHDLGFSDEERVGLYALVIGVVSVGNVKFRETKPDESEPDPSSQKWLETAAHNFGVDVAVLGKALTTREIRIRGQEKVFAVQDIKQATDAAAALAKFAYSRMFDWLVERVNKSMGGSSANSGMLFIGILDIFGFEIFKHNSFEQLCINFTNEMLQQHFNNNTFKLEEQVYRSEGIEFQHIDFIDNEPMIELITGKRIGVLSILDEELIVPGGSDGGFLEKLGEEQARNPVYVADNRTVTNFGIKHYAGVVVYDGKGFLEKNRDMLYLDLIEMLQSSSSSFINLLYPPEMEVTAKDRKSSLSKQFQGQLAHLMKQLYRTEPHYIRCIKPNEHKKPLNFVAQNCFEQLTYSGVFEAVAIRKQGYPFRLSHADFAERYSKICSGISVTAPRDVCVAVIKKLKLDTENVRIGKSKVLYRAMEYRKMELEWEIVTKNERIHKNLEKLTKVDWSGFGHDEKEAFIIQLADAVQQADLFKIKTPAAEKGRSMLEMFVEERMDPETKSRLEKAKRTMDRDLLDDVLEHCGRMGYITKLVRACRELQEKVEDAEGALDMAKREMKEEFLERALAMCDEFGYNAASVQEARKLLKSIVKAKEGCARALEPPHNLQWLTQAVEYCIKLNFTSFQGFVDCNFLRAKIKEAETMLDAAEASLDETKLEQALNFCYDKTNFKGHKYKCDKEAVCRELHKKVKWVNKEVVKATRECEERQVRAVVSEATKIGMTALPTPDPALKALIRLVKGDYNKFLAEQFKKAKKCRHHARAIRVALKQKTREYGKKSTVLHAADYGALKESLAWSKEKWHFGRDSTRAAKMMKWQEAHLHAPLTTALARVADREHVTATTEKIIHAFDTVQKFMGQRNTRNMDLRLNEMLHNAALVPEVRDEVYLGIIKQSTDNRDEPDGRLTPQGPTARGFELIALCLCVFPPSQQFEDYLEHYIREPQYKSYSDEYNLPGLLRRRMYHGSVTATEVPSQSEFGQSVAYNGTKYHTGATSAVLAARLKLKEFIEPKGKKGSSKAEEIDDEEGEEAEEPAEAKKKKKKKSSKKKKEKQDAKPWSEGTAVTAKGAQPSPWKATLDPGSGKYYYWNSVTAETTWTPPSEGYSEA